jgi:hypothetical protein
MKKTMAIMTGMVWLAAVAAGAAPWEPGLVAHIHFAGGAAVAADPNAAALKKIWTSPDAVALQAQTLDKLDRSVEGWLHQKVVPTLSGSVALRPLLEDLSRCEWELDLRQPTADTVEFALAVRLDNARSQAWQTTLTPVVEGWKMSSPRHHAGITRTGDWLRLSLGSSAAPAAAGAIAPLQNVWLTADVDWGRLAVWFPELRKLDPPQTRLQVAGRNGNFEVTGKLFLAQPLAALPAWQFPTNTIHAPFISLTAARGISTWLKQQPWVAAMGLHELPDQVFTWAMPQIPFESYAAMPLASAPAALPALERSLNGFLHDGTADSPYKGITLLATNNRVAVLGLPLMAPYFEARPEPAGEYLMGGFFPNTPGKPAPPQLLAWQGRPGLVFYHWENTAERLKDSPQLYNLILAISKDRQVLPNFVAGKWLSDLAPTLGTTTTEAIQTGPNEVTFTRTAPAGLTAAELVALASWLEAPNFPGWELRLAAPPRLIRRPGAPAPGTPGAPAPFPLHN